MTVPTPTPTAAIEAAALVARLRARRIELGLTQTQLATRMGHESRSTICNLEKGRFQPGLLLLVAWFRALEWELSTPSPDARRGEAGSGTTGDTP